jgi:trk system potassium uptake protein TrkH
MNYAIVFKLQSAILSIIAAAFAASLAIAWAFDRENHYALAVNGFAISLLVAVTLAFGCFLIGKTGDNTLRHKEALTVIGLGWLVASSIGALPFALILPELSVAGAFFESASGLTTTGASVLAELERLPASLHFWRCGSQWIGGLGVVVFFVAILSFLGVGAKTLFSRESSAQAADLDTARIQKGVLRITQIYIALSFLCFVAYRACGLPPFEALLHMFTTISTGGFSTRTASLLAFQNPALEWTAIAFMAIGGTSFLLINELLRGQFAKVLSNTELRAYGAIIVSASLLVLGFLYHGDSAAASILASLRVSAFQVVSILTTTGFATADYTAWLPVTHLLLLTLMFIGGCSGSTAGGAKVIRWAVWVRVSILTVERAYRPRVVRPLHLNGKPLPKDQIDSVSSYLILLVLVLALALLAIAFFEPQMSFAGTVSAVAACLFNVGPGLAEVGPAFNFAGLHAYSKMFLSLLMIMGRLELFAILVLFSPTLWKRY